MVGETFAVIWAWYLTIGLCLTNEYFIRADERLRKKNTGAREALGYALAWPIFLVLYIWLDWLMWQKKRRHA
jgi:hypothetical protein